MIGISWLRSGQGVEIHHLRAGSLASVATLVWATPLLAETTIDTSRTTPVATSTAASGAADDLSITSGGSVTPSAGAAVTLDSDNTVSNAGTIQVEDASDATGVLVLGGHTGSVTNSGAIQVDETTEIDDVDDDGDYDGPFATGSRRYGVRVIGTAPFTGALTNSGSIVVEGNDSAAISVETDLMGAIAHSGSIAVTGDRSYGLKTSGAVGGDLSITGSVSALGAGSTALQFGGDIAGGLTIQSSVVATGYRSTARSTDQDTLDALDADDLLQGGPALEIKASIARGLFIDSPPANTDDENDDEDGDGVDDSSEGTGVVASYGAAPAVVIGAVGRDVALGDVGTGGSAYGIVNAGSITAYGVYDGISATALELGVAGGGTVTTGSGIRNAGTISASSYEAGATGVRLNAGAIVPAIRNEGVITAGVAAESAATAQALVIEAGAAITTLDNIGTISAAVSGETGSAVAIVDRSGSLAVIQNTGQISASVTATDNASDTDDADTDASNETVTGSAIALDLSANTTGVTLTQTGVGDGDDDADGVADDDEDGDGVDDTDEPAITGEVLLGSGDDRLDILNGTLTGAIAFGAGANSLTIDGGASVAGDITVAGGSLALSIGNGALEIDNIATLDLTSLQLSASSSLVVTADPASGTATLLDVAGTASLANGAKLGLRLTSLVQDQATYIIIQADTLTVGALDTSLLGEIPYLYNAAVLTDAAAGTVAINLDRKSANELALPASVSDAYEPMIQAIDRDTEVRDAFLAPTDRTELLSVYNQMLPDHQGAIFRMAGANADAFARAVEDRLGPEAGGAWLQETGFAIVRDSTADEPGYKAWSIGLMAGLESGETRFGILGASLAGASGEVNEDDAASGESLVVSMVEGGGYWRLSRGSLFANARFAASWIGVSSTRAVAVYDDDERTLYRTTEGDWSGAGLSGKVMAGHEMHFGSLFVRPGGSVDYLWLREGAYTESGGGDAVDLAVEERTSSRLSAFVGVTAGLDFGDDGWWGPELQVGWRQVAGSGGGDTTARFVSGGDSFTLLADDITGGGVVVRGALKGGGVGGDFAVEGGAEMRDGLAIYDMRLAAHFKF